MNFRNPRKFFRKQYRDVFGTSITGTTAAQIRAMREKREWNQHMLAEKAGMGQARISLLENPNYQNLSLNTLKRIANVFDVALLVRFVPFSKLFAMIEEETAETLAPRSFAEEFGREMEPASGSGAKVIDLLPRLKQLVDAQNRAVQEETPLALLAQMQLGRIQPLERENNNLERMTREAFSV